jgi:hypothetical protein
MSFEFWKTVFDWSAVVLLGLTFIAGFGALVTGKVVGDRQARKLQIDLDAAKNRAGKEESERRALVNRILDIYGPRQPEKHSADIVKKLAGLEGVKIDVYVEDIGDPPDSPEFKDSVKTALAVLSMLRAAHVDEGGWIVKSCQGGHAEALNVSVAEDANDNDRKIARKVLDAFPHELGTFSAVQDGSPAAFCTLSSELDKDRPNRRKPNAAISIIIGRKVNPLLTREMLEPPDDQIKP